MVTKIETDQKIKTSHDEHRDGKVVTKVEMDEQNSNGRLKSRHERNRAQRNKGKIGPGEHERFHGEVLDGSKLKQDDDMTDKNVNQARTSENDSERDVYQVRTHQKVETIWLFDTRADVHVMPKRVWEQLGELHCKQQK